ncbi:unnamed protein product [Phytophthora fragariaefolia]|uniref:Unnamed protein product n=1 Tax=Phytophthora fragariaefolia TaxID=1490495 RepID=A0A9W7D373_9STRA|nr:unnamed protein product [Phytophthora fragariaefolia]
MLRRLKTSSDASQPSPNSAPDESEVASEQGASDGPMSSLQKYRSQTMKDYGLMIEYKHLRQHVPSGIYVLPSFDHSRIWYGAIFVHAGLYRNGIFKFTIFLPERSVTVTEQPNAELAAVAWKELTHVFAAAGAYLATMDRARILWDPELHYMVAVLTYLKGIFYMKDFPDVPTVANSVALDMYVVMCAESICENWRVYSVVIRMDRFRHDPDNYVNKVEECVDESLTNVYNNEQGSTIRFTKHNPAHDNLRQELFAQLDAAPVRAAMVGVL